MEPEKNYSMSDILAKKIKTEKRLFDNLMEMGTLRVEYKEAPTRSKSMIAGKIAFLCQDTQRLAEGLEVLNKQVVAMVDVREQ